MLDQSATVQPEVEVLERDEHSMQLMEYALAIVALAAAVLLTILR